VATLLSQDGAGHLVSADLAEPAPRPSQPAGPQAGLQRIRVLLADDHVIVRDSLAHLLQMQPDMEVVAKAVNGAEAVDLALELRPDVIIMDINMPVLSGIQAAKQILEHLSEAKIIALSMYSAAEMDSAMRHAGACDYVAKESAPEMLVEAIRRHASHAR
jgi:DNA-binding NarL/FixJ family response regulator